MEEIKEKAEYCLNCKNKPCSIKGCPMQTKIPEFITEIKNENLENIFLISDTKNALALEINNEGLVINRSKLLVSDEMNLIEMIYSLKEVKIEYEKIKKYEARKELRQIEKIKKLIKCEIDLLYQEKNRSKLKYLYYEWFNTVENSLEKMYEEMNTELEKNFSEKLNNIYDLIKLSYHKISG